MKYQINDHKIILIGSQPTCHIHIPSMQGTVSFVENHLYATDVKVKINGKTITDITDVQNGDIIEISSGKTNLEIIFNADYIEINSEEDIKSSLKEYIGSAERFEGFPIFKRSPRIIKREPQIKIELQSPSEKEKRKKGELIKQILPSAVMIIATVAISFFMRGGFMMLAMVMATSVTIGITIVSYFDDKKQSKIDEAEREENYKNYLLKMRKKLYVLKEEFKESKNYHNLSLADIQNEANCYSNRMYERGVNDSDFLDLALGRATVEPSFTVSYSQDEINVSKDPMYLEMKDVYNNFNEVSDIPYVINLKNAHLGLVGYEEYIKERMFNIVTQLSFSQSYHDIEIIVLIDEADKEDFQWMRWLPHCKVKGINVSGLISGENQRDQVLGHINQVLKGREIKRDESKKDARFTPHYIFAIASPKLIINHSIMEHLKADNTDLGFSLIYGTNISSNLPENIKTILMIDAEDQGTVLLNEGSLVNIPIKFESNEGIDFERIARMLAPIIHNKGMSTQLPESITFFDLYGIKHPSELNIAQRWKDSNSAKSLSVPLGVRGTGKEDVVLLNLHEKEHGPHGLVAGTTGSGKSEILQSYILSLAANFHPDEVGFLLIDYKGGGMADLFNDLPHLLGIITNLDGSESMRALESIKSELRRRQAVFSANDVNNINKYTEKYKAGLATEPMPHLFIISDEFAELKKEQPDFMGELVTTARVGRSLGVHLILATQKPSGVVDDQIWSNSRFKLALKVQDEMDSKEILKTPDAANITQPGRAYLQVGNNEIYELFQSAYSGALYNQEVEKYGIDERIYVVNELGQRHLLNGDVIDSKEGDSMGKSQLNVLVEELADVYAQENCAPIAKPWLPPLESQVPNPTLSKLIDDDKKAKIKDVAQFTDLDLSVSIGVVDIPDMQKQEIFCHDFQEKGNLAVYGAPATGKSTLLMNAALDLAIKNSPSLLNYYIVDFGNSALITLKELVHTADYINFDETEKYEKLKTLLSGEIARRKRLFSKTNSTNIKMYNRVAEEKIPAIIVFVDNYDVIKEMGYDEESYFTTMTRDGLSVGIYMAAAASGSTSMKYAVFNNFSTKVSNLSIDDSDHLAIVGRSKYTVADIKGRSLVKYGEGAYLMQEYLPCIAEDAIEYTDKIKSFIKQVTLATDARGPEAIPILPEKLYVHDLLARKKNEAELAIGLDSDTVNVVSINDPLFLIVGGAESGKTNVLRLILKQIPEEEVDLFIFDSTNQDLSEYGEHIGNHYLSKQDDANAFSEALTKVVTDRETAYAESAENVKAKIFYKTLTPVYLIIDDVEEFKEYYSLDSFTMCDLLDRAVKTGVNIIVTTVTGSLSQYDEWGKVFLKKQNGLVLGNPTEQSEFEMDYHSSLPWGEDTGYFIIKGSRKRIMIPLAQGPQDEFE